MTIEDKITVTNYKCFDSEGSGFERLLPINVIIGKNNSGKSSLIDLARFLVQGNEDFIKTGRDNLDSDVVIEHPLTEFDLESAFSKTTLTYTSRFGNKLGSDFDYGQNFIGKIYAYALRKNEQKDFYKFEPEFYPEYSNNIDRLPGIIKGPFQGKLFCNITAERDIIQEKSGTETILEPNGSGATNYIQEILNRTDRDSKLIEITLLEELNKIINPDVQFSRILVQLNRNEKWEIFFEDLNTNRIALSKMGSGIKTIILVLLNLIVRPALENQDKSRYVFAFEELENNLHPSLQRRLYAYIREYSKVHSTYFFITTHSNIVIDTFGTDPNAQMIHVINDGVKSVASTVLSHDRIKKVLQDLDVRASDLLQSNGVIWVEGPSDRNYINKWLEVAAPELQEGLHYSIMFYGGRLLANLSFDYEWFNKDIIPLLKVNRNAFVIMDRDGKNERTKINDTKTRITTEIGEENCWITKGREIENYLTDKVISTWLSEKHSLGFEVKNDKEVKLENNITNADPKTKIKYNTSKTIYSNEIVQFIDEESMGYLDLRERVNGLVKKIKDWNSMG